LSVEINDSVVTSLNSIYTTAKYIAMPSISASDIEPYTHTFTTGDFVDGSISVSESTHNKGADCIVQSYEDLGDNTFQENSDTVSIIKDADGNITITVDSGQEFNGKLEIY